MKEWFKARNVWAGAFEALSDAEAGRLAKALWKFTTTGQQEDLTGAEKGCFAMILFTLRQDADESAELSEIRKAAGSLGGKQKAANVANASFATEDVADVANVAIKNKNKNKNINTTTTACAREETFTGPVDLDPLILKIQQELNGLTDTHYAALNDYREQLGDDVVSYAVDLAVGNGIRNWSYVEIVLRGWVKAGVKTLGEAKAENERHRSQPKQPQAAPKLLRSQDYHQRKYEGSKLEQILGVDDIYKEGSA